MEVEDGVKKYKKNIEELIFSTILYVVCKIIDVKDLHKLRNIDNTTVITNRTTSPGHIHPVRIGLYTN